MALIYPNRSCERRRWVRFCFIGISDRAYSLKEVKELDEINAASKTTIILDRMIRQGKMRRP